MSKTTQQQIKNKGKGNPNWKGGISSNKKEYKKNHYLKNKEKQLIESKKDYKNNPEQYKERSKLNYKNNKEKIKLNSSKWQKTEKGKEYKRKYNKIPENRKKETIREKTRRENEKKEKCIKCGNIGKTQFHHLEYEKDKFIELCLKCHKKEHNKQIISDGWIEIPELNILVEEEIHHKNKSYDDLVKEFGEEFLEENLPTYAEIQALRNLEHKGKYKLGLIDTWEFVKQEDEISKKNGRVARFVANSDYCDLGCYRNSGYSDSDLGVRFIKRKVSKEIKK